MSSFIPHDHGKCIESSLEAAEEICVDRKLQLTPVRRRSLEILLEAHTALGAYDLLNRLQDEGLGTHPPVAYRALDFLVAQGLAHKIEHLNAYVACAHPEDGHAPVFLICEACKTVSETMAPQNSHSLTQAAQKSGFKITRMVVEAQGLCPSCQEAQA